MKEKLKELKNRNDQLKEKKKELLEIFFDKEELEIADKSAANIMINILGDLLYYQRYMEIFAEEINKDISIKEAEKIYDINIVNKHLTNILNEYIQLTKELDEIIFKEDNLG